MARQAFFTLALLFVALASVVIAEGPAPSPSQKAEAPDASSPSTSAEAPTTSSTAPNAASPTSTEATPSSSPSLSPKSSAAETPNSDSPTSGDSMEESPSGSPEEGPAAGPDVDDLAPTESTPADVQTPPKKNGAMTLKLSFIAGVAAVMASSLN
ncbi:hypothetical protein BVRB_6g145090 [Beta vulgaris subsp. vulgaris]|uniref:Uncharacterized protein n=1 Tax=Beta vulgaris subsp. vulgaris TaxID=3555 RepID=A0A0J8C6U3_BETVV|nr:hypothetical protein BVRB_6g145090 [Beta vulgaris subsp. vulgaris]